VTASNPAPIGRPKRPRARARRAATEMAGGWRHPGAQTTSRKARRSGGTITLDHGGRDR
jgi:hypothetical protein